MPSRDKFMQRQGGSMKALKTWFSKLSLRHKWAFAIYGAVIPLLLVCTVFLYYQSYISTRQEESRLRERIAQNSCREIASLQADLLDMATYFAVNSQIKAVLATPKQNTPQDSLFWYRQTPMTFVEDIFAIKSHMKTLTLYPENGFRPYNISGDLSVCNDDFDAVRTLDTYSKAVAAQGDVLWTRTAASSDGLFLQSRNEKIIAYRELFDLSKKNRLAFLVIGMDAQEYTKICQSMLQTDIEGSVVLSAEGEELARAGTVPDSLLETARKHQPVRSVWNKDTNGSFSDNTYDVYTSSNGDTGVQVCYFSSRASWISQARQTLFVPMLLMAVLIVVAIPLSTFMARFTLRSTQALYEGIGRFEDGDFNYQVPVETQDEMGALTQAFNRMVINIRDLVDNNYILALREKESELDALQTQINPHFLYNALDCLYWQAVNENQEELGENILALSQMFRQLLSQGQSTITVGQEAELIQSYLKIQKMRFGDKLRYSVDLALDILNCPMPKLTLQPFVENAVVHGLEGLIDGGEINLKGWREENMLHFVINDNGSGMTQEEADNLLAEGEQDNQSGHIGRFAIRNIKQRLTLRYHSNYSLNITSSVGQGTCVEVSFPTDEYSA